MTTPMCSNLNTLWAELLVEELCRGGVDTFVLSPGSRSTPLVAAISGKTEAHRIVHFDERGAAFYALGRARAQGRPVVWVTTSGTAVANGYPAVVEASQSGAPLILLTADRPPELQRTGANQTIDQARFFGAYARRHIELPCPTLDIPPQMVLTTAAQALYAATHEPAGPVHVNCMYREPLLDAQADADYTTYMEPLAKWVAGSQPYSQHVSSSTAPTPGAMEAVVTSMSTSERGLLVVGQLSGGADEEDAVRHLGEKLGWPILPDISSGLRLGPHASQLVPYYDLALASNSFTAAQQPDCVLHLGGPLTSKRLGLFLRDANPSAYIHVHRGGRRQDPFHRVRLQVDSDIAAFAKAIGQRVDGCADAAWHASWTSASQSVGRVLDEYAARQERMDEILAARQISSLAPGDSALFLANSMPIRDMNMHGAPGGPAVRVLANRGASGIDGNIATAVGFGSALARPVTAVMGDLTVLHDLNSLSLAASSSHPVHLVVMNNRGGGIFHFLPVAEHTSFFEEYVATPHAFAFEEAARMFGLAYAAPETPDAFAASYKDALTAGDSCIIEVATNREDNLQRHRVIEQRVVEALAD